MNREIDKQKINDFINVYCELLGLDKSNPKHKIIYNYFKESIYRRTIKYKDIKVPVSIDNYSDYIIKPTNGEWNIEDFLLNRLFASIRKIDLETNNANETGILADYTGANGELSFSLDDVLATNKSFYKTDKDAINSTYKTFSHEVGHALKTQYSGGYRFFSLRNDQEKNDTYIKLIERLKSFNNGQYADEIIDNIDNAQEIGNAKTGVRGKNGSYLEKIKIIYKPELLDEMLNEDEAIELSDISTSSQYTKIYDKDRKEKSGYALDVPNKSSGYSKYYGIGIQLKYVLGKKKYFEIQYGNTDKVAEEFDKMYQDISSEMFGENKYTPLQVIYYNNYSISKEKRTYVPFLETNEFLARCYEKRLKKYLSNNKYNKETLDRIIAEIDEMLKYTTHHINKETDKNLPHIKIYN